MKFFVSGSNQHGQLNGLKIKDEIMEMKLNFKIKQIACGYNHVLILTENNSELYGCGGNAFGSLGLDKEKTVSEFTKIIDCSIFDNVDYNNEEIKTISCGGYFSTFLTNKNNLYLTGQGLCGQLGFGNFINLLKFTKSEFNFGKIKIVKCGAGVTVVLNENGQFYFSGDLQKKVSNFTKFYFNSEIINFECGFEHLIMLDKFGQVFYFGHFSKKIVNLPFPFKIKQIGSSLNSITILNENNELYFRKEPGFELNTNNHNKKNEFIKTENSVNKIFSGKSNEIYFLSKNKQLLYFKENDLKSKILFEKFSEKFIYLFNGYNFVYVITTDKKLFGEEEDKNVKRMFMILCNQLVNCKELCDVVFLFE